MTVEEARQAAMERFGDVEAVEHWLRSHDRGREFSRGRREIMRDLLYDIRVTLRGLRRTPGFALVTILTLAFGIGANTAVFSVVSGVLLRPLPFPKPNELVKVWIADPTRQVDRVPISPVDIDDWRIELAKTPGAVADVGGYWYTEGQSGTDLIGLGEPRRVAATYITPGFFTTLGVRAQLGRLPRNEEMVRGADDKLVVLSDPFWRSAFGASSSVVGTRLNLGGVSFQVVGVLPPDLNFPAPRVDLYIPASSLPDRAVPRQRQVRWMEAVGRLRTGSTLAQAREQLGGITRQLSAVYTENARLTGATVVPLQEAITGSVRSGLLVLLVAVMMVLLVTCVNLASLMLARAMVRNREFAIRAALGAGRGRVIQQLLTESTVLSLLGGMLGAAVAYAGARMLVAFSAGQIPRTEGVRLDLPVLGFLLGISVLTGLLLGLIPAWRVSTTALQASLREGGRGSTSHRGHGLRSVLVVSQVAISVVLVIGAALMTQSFIRLNRVDLGFQADQVLVESFTIPEARAMEDGQMSSYLRAVLDQVATLPGVISVGAARVVPFRGTGETATAEIQGASNTDQGLATARIIHVSDGYFVTMGIPILAGREFARTDSPNRLVLVVNRAFLHRYFPQVTPTSAVGRHIVMGGTDAEIIGVAGDVRQAAPSEPAEPTFYLSYFQNGRVKVDLVVRTNLPWSIMDGRIKQAIWSIEKNQTFTAVFPMREAVGDALARPRLFTALLGLFGVIGLTLGGLGLFGVLAYLVAERRREIGVRLALGAPPKAVLAMVVRRGLLLALIGVGVGIVGSALVTRFMQGVLFGVGSGDPVTFVAVALGLLLVALVASAIPARRATKIDPIIALQND
jgi:predicted permease